MNGLDSVDMTVRPLSLLRSVFLHLARFVPEIDCPYWYPILRLAHLE